MMNDQWRVDRRHTLISLLVAVVAAILLLTATVFRPAFRGTLIINPVALTVGPIQVRWYGVVLALAIGTAYEWSRRRLITRGIDANRGDAVLWWAAIGGILGARLGYVVQNLGYFVDHPAEILAFTQGGLSIHGAVLGGALAVWIAARKHSVSEAAPPAGRHTLEVNESGGRWPVSFLTWADIIAPTVLLGAIIGRFGNFLNYELYGSPTELPWKMFVPIAYRLPGFESSAFFHPTFLYEALGNLIMLGFVLWYEKRARGVILSNAKDLHSSQVTSVDSSTEPQNDTQPGRVFFLTVALYSITRFLVEFIRLGDPLALGLTLAQWVSLGLMVVSGIALIRRRA